MTGGILSTYDLKQKANSDSLVSFMGVIRAKDEIKMNRMIIRMGRGRAIATFFDMDIPQYLSFNIMNKDEEKNIYSDISYRSKRIFNEKNVTNM